jgi:Site-specific recombinase
MKITHLGPAPFPEGFLAGLNYAVSFVVLQVLGLVLATKQPSMTAAKLASLVRDNRGDSRIEEIVAYFARIFRSQLAAALENVILVSLGAVAFDQLWRLGTGKPYLSEELAIYALVSLSPVSTGTAVYAALTGVILWLSSLLGGWIENWYVYNRLPQGLKELPIGKRIRRKPVGKVGGWIVSKCLGVGGEHLAGVHAGHDAATGPYSRVAARRAACDPQYRNYVIGSGSPGKRMAQRGMVPVRVRRNRRNFRSEPHRQLPACFAAGAANLRRSVGRAAAAPEGFGPQLLPEARSLLVAPQRMRVVDRSGCALKRLTSAILENTSNCPGLQLGASPFQCTCTGSDVIAQ